MQEKYKELIATIAEYESDTFSASGSELTAGEAEQVAETMVVRVLQDMIDCKIMDGDELSEVLETVREK